MLLISDKTLFQKKYNDEEKDITWADCTLRAYLNGEFYDNCFSNAEQEKIATTHLINSNNPDYGTFGGNDTDDKIFLLSIDEANQYFSSDNDRIAKNYKGEDDNWRLRSPGNFAHYAALVNYEGLVYNDGFYVGSDYIAVRPALWMNLK